MYAKYHFSWKDSTSRGNKALEDCSGFEIRLGDVLAQPNDTCKTSPASTFWEMRALGKGQVHSRGLKIVF
ncbi:hypothetical protein THAOC_04511 [Thalassiosira oceanica]|uniref:Uncharacterized protein n=1 Tax=Thalassiosira oceanica TaxID=159749 RepID=K0T9S3_THAOC|nr:hypothetical protein THAOC_04511 [Thalassiosira oceanica]|eukprot:EJK73844.1 hypothetical protein THAOC_04511 [Thalassiosira oceanica]